MAEVLVTLVVALLGSGSMVVAAVLTHRSGAADRADRRREAELRYLAERLDRERERAEALEAEVRARRRSA